MLPHTDTLRIGFIFEGETDLETIPALVAKIINHRITPVKIDKETNGFDDFKRRKQNRSFDTQRSSEDRQLTETQRPWGTLKSYIISLIIKGVDAIVIVVDNDGETLPKRWCQIASNLPYYEPISVLDTCGRAGDAHQVNMQTEIHAVIDHILAQKGQGRIPIVIGVAVEMLEAWLLAQPEIVATVLWELFTPDELARCEHPEMITHPKNELIKNNNGGSDLSQKQARLIGQHANFSPVDIERRCPSFGLFVADVGALNE
jgi:hypothetical protein